MEISESQSEHEDHIAIKQMISRDFNTGRYSRSHRHTFEQGNRGVITGVGGPAFPHQRLVLLSLGLLNAALLIAALVIGIYCSKAPDYLQMSHSAIAPLIIERNFLRNHTDLIRAKVMDKAALARERGNTVRLQVQVKQEMALSDRRQGHIEELKRERSHLQGNKTSLESSCGKCQPGWVFSKPSCYFYSHPDAHSKKNWQDSREDCISRGGDLLIINSTQEQDVIIHNYPRVSSVGPWWQNGFWIGLTDTVVANVWIWINNVPEVSRTYWKYGQPSNSAPQTGHCAALYREPLASKMLYNANCQNHRLNWICEMQPR